MLCSISLSVVQSLTDGHWVIVNEHPSPDKYNLLSICLALKNRLKQTFPLKNHTRNTVEITKGFQIKFSQQVQHRSVYTVEYHSTKNYVFPLYLTFQT